jgi:hypothetical protein
MDLAYNLVPAKKYRNIMLVVAAGFGYLMIPLSRVMVTLITDYPYSSFLKYGFTTPLVTFLLFGMLGGLLGTGIYQIGKKLFNKK